MLISDLRGKASTWIVKILLVLIILSFALWGVPEMLQSFKSGDVVAEIGDTKIQQKVLEQRLQAILQQGRGQITLEQLVEKDIPKQMLDKMIDEVLLDESIQNMKMTIDDAFLVGELRHDPEFKEGDGKSFADKFKELLNATGLTEKELLNNLRWHLLRAQLRAAISGNIYVPKKIEDMVIKGQLESRGGDFIFISYDVQAVKEKPTDADLESYYAAHAGDFVKGEQRQATVLILSPKDLVQDKDITPEQMEKTYKESIDLFTTPEKRDVWVAPISKTFTMDKATAVVKSGRLQNGFTHMGLVQQGDLADNLSKTAFSLAEGTLSDEIKDADGSKVIYVSKIIPSAVQPLHQDKAKTKKVLESAKAAVGAEKLATILVELDDKIAGGSSLEDVAKEYSFKVIKTPLLDREGRPDSKDKKKPAPLDDGILATIFAQPEKIDGSFKDLSDGRVFMVRVDQVVPPATPPLTDIKPAVEAAWKMDKQKEKAQKLAADLEKAVRNKAFKASMVPSKEAQLVPFPPMTRIEVAQSRPLPMEAIDDMFTEPLGTPVVGKTDIGIFVIIPKTIQKDRIKQLKKEDLEALNETTKAWLLQGLSNSYLLSLRDKFGVKINEEALASITKSGTAG